MSDTANALSARMDTGISVIRSQLASARLTLATSVDLFSGGSGAAASSELEAHGRAIDSLDGPQRARVLAQDPAYPFSRWTDELTRISTAIAVAVHDSSEWSFFGVIGNTASATAADAKKAVEEGTPWLVVGLVAIAATYALMTFRSLRGVA